MKKCAYEKYLLCERFQVTFYFDRKSHVYCRTTSLFHCLIVGISVTHAS